MVKRISVILVLLVAVFAMAGCGNRSNNNEPRYPFSYSYVRVTLTDVASAREAEWTVDDFNELDFVSLVGIFMTGERLNFSLRLAESGRDNVLHAVQLLNLRDEVYMARVIYTAMPGH